MPAPPPTDLSTLHAEDGEGRGRDRGRRNRLGGNGPFTRLDPREPWNRTAAIGVLALLVAALFAPILARGQVVFPHDNRLELVLPPAESDAFPSNRRFVDQACSFVPELHHHLQGNPSGWLSAWNPHVQLGRPSFHLYGLSPAFLPTRVLSFFTRDPFVAYTWLVAGTVFLTCLFTFLFLEAMGLCTLAGLAGAVGLGMGVFAVYWLTFVMFLSGLCWTSCCLWLTARFLRRPSFARGLAIAFAVHALLLTAYPQQIVWHGYFVAGFALAHWWRGPNRHPIRLLALGASATLGVVAAGPVYLDLLLQVSRSARIDTEPEFFLEALPRIDGVHELGQYLGALFDAFWRGNPILRDAPEGFAGVSLTPLFASLVLVSWLEGLWRRTWPWLAFSLGTLCLTLFPQAYLFGIRHLGLSLSRFVPLVAALIPLAIAGGIALDHLLTKGFARPWRAVAVAACAPAVALLAARGVEVDGARVALGLALFAGFVALVFSRRGALALGLVVLTTVAYGATLPLVRPRDSIATTSPLVERLRELTCGGERYALLGTGGGRLLTPNLEAQLGLASIHSYDSVSSRAYRKWVQGLSERGTRKEGRHFKRIIGVSRLGGEEFALSGVAVVVSSTPQSSEHLRFLERAGAQHLYAPVRPARMAFRLDGASAGPPEREDVWIENLSERPTSAVRVLARHDDELLLELEPSSGPSVVWLSVQHHPHWKVDSDVDSRRACLNGFYLGAWLAPGATRVRFTFRPHARWMWVVHAAFGLAALAALGLQLFSRPGRPAGAPVDPG